MEINQSINVMRNEKRILPAVPFRKMVIHLSSFKRRQPATVFLGSEKFGFGIKKIFPTLGSFHKITVVIHFSEFQGHLSNTPIVISIFHRFGNTFMLIIYRNKSVLFISIQSKM